MQTNSSHKICILICGGTVLQTPSGSLHAALKKEDIPTWLAAMPEVELLTKELDVIFLHEGGDADVSVKLWQEAARFMYHNQYTYAGFVLLSGRDNIPYFAESLSLMLENPTKPILITGSQFPDYVMQYPAAVADIAEASEDIGIRANLINAIHVIRSSIPGVYVMFGDRLIQGNSLELTRQALAIPFRYPKEHVVGSIEFSIKLTPEHEKKLKGVTGEMRLCDTLETRIWYGDGNPLCNEREMADALEPYRGAIFFVPSTVSYPRELVETLRARSPEIPVVLCGRSLILPRDVRAIASDLEKEGIILVHQGGREQAIVRFMWALGRTSDFQEIKRILIRD